MVIPLVILFVCDQVVKFVIISMIDEGDVVRVGGDFLNICHIRNRGMVFGLLKEDSYLPIPLTIALLLLIIFSYRWIKEEGVIPRIGTGLIIGGAVGNLFDRILHGGVIDFLDIGIGRMRWPVFNLADAGICVGAGLLIYYWLKEKGKVDAKSS